MESHSIVVYVNSTPYCTNIELEHHRGPCKCECSLTPSACTERQRFLSNSCSCACLPSLASEKRHCHNSSIHMWDSDTCQCICRQNNICLTGQYFNTETCQCEQSVLSGKLECSNQTGINPSLNLYPVLVIVMAVILFLLLVTSLSFTISTRWRSNSHQLRPLEPQPKAYTITLCSNQSLDKAT